MFLHVQCLTLGPERAQVTVINLSLCPFVAVVRGVFFVAFCLSESAETSVQAKEAAPSRDCLFAKLRSCDARTS